MQRRRGPREGELHGGAGIGDCALMRLLATWAHASQGGQLPVHTVATDGLRVRRPRQDDAWTQSPQPLREWAHACEGGQLHVHTVATDGLPRAPARGQDHPWTQSPPSPLLRDPGAGPGFEVRRVVAVGVRAAAAQRLSEHPTGVSGECAWRSAASGA